MAENSLLDQAQAIAGILPLVTRQLFVADDSVAAQLPLAQLRVCGILFGGPQSMSVLGRELAVSLSAMTQIADRLERARLVKRVTVGTDRRVRCLQLTGRGEKFMQQRHAILVDRIAAVLEHLPPNERKQVLMTLEALMQGCLSANRDRQVAGQAG